MLIRSQGTTILQIFCDLLLYSQVIFRSIRVADDTFKRNSECEWVKAHRTVYFQVHYRGYMGWSVKTVSERRGYK